MLRNLLLDTSTLTTWPHIYDLMWPRPPFFPMEGKTYVRTFMASQMKHVGIVYDLYRGVVSQHVYSECSDYWYPFYPIRPFEVMILLPIVFHHAGHKAFHWAIDEWLSRIFSTPQAHLLTPAA